MMNTEKENSRSLETAREFVKLANSYALYKRTEGYDENNYSYFDIFNLDASLEICNRGPADYYYEKAYDMFCDKLGADHPETRQVVQDIINYHLNNAKRMMFERFFISAIFMVPCMYLLISNLFESVSWQGVLFYYGSYALVALSWILESYILCILEKQHYQKKYLLCAKKRNSKN